MSVDTRYRDLGLAAIKRNLGVLDGLEIHVGIQGQTGYRAVQQRVMRRSGARSKPKGRKRKGRKRRRRRPSSGRPRREPKAWPKRRARRTVVKAVPGLRVVDLATIHEYGSKKAKIPERSFLRATFRNHLPFLKKLEQRTVKAVLAGNDPIVLAEQLGLRFENAVKKTLTDLKTPRLAASTRRRRYLMTGDADPNPLIDTGQLRASITSIVVRGGRRMGGL
jgi:phage gpG-like protein